MRCPKCQAGAKTHTVIEEDRSALGGGRISRSFDEQDRAHVHDPKWDLVYYRCSHGHAFQAATPALPCTVEGCGFADSMQKKIDETMSLRYPKAAGAKA